MPVLLGGDLNAYSMAMSFARAAGVVSHVFAREKLAMTDTSSFIKLHSVKDLDDYNVAVPVLLNFAKEHKGERLLLIPCADWYMEMLEYARDALHGHFYFFIPDFEIWRTTSDKATFLSILSSYGIPHPRTEIFDERMQGFQKKGQLLVPPFVVKASDSSEYFRHPFKKMKKVYFTHSLHESRQIIEKIYSSGYSGKVLLQEYVKERGIAREPTASVLTTYSNKHGQVIRAVLGDVLLEERGDTSRGNYSAIVTRPLDDISMKLIRMLEGIGYTGIANFDILTSGTKSFCLELNPRQGRSFDYVRGSGMNIAELLIAEMENRNIPESFKYPECFWRAVSRRTAIRHATHKGLLNKALMLEKNGRATTPYDFKKDFGMRRRLYVMAHLLRYEKRFRQEGEAFECGF